MAASTTTTATSAGGSEEEDVVGPARRCPRSSGAPAAESRAAFSVVVIIDDNDNDTSAPAAPTSWRASPAPGAMHAAVCTAARAPHAGQHRYPVRKNRAPTFVLPPADLTPAELQQAEACDNAPAAARRVPSWLPVGTPLPAPNSRGPAEAGGVSLRGCWAQQEATGPRLPYRGCIRKWWTDSLVACEEDPQRPDRGTKCRDDHRRCYLVSRPPTRTRPGV